MTRNNDICLNTIDVGCIWGKMSDFAEVNRVAKSNISVQYIGNYMTWDNNVYAVFHTDKINYIVLLK